MSAHLFAKSRRGVIDACAHVVTGQRATNMDGSPASSTKVKKHRDGLAQIVEPLTASLDDWAGQGMAGGPHCGRRWMARRATGPPL